MKIVFLARSLEVGGAEVQLVALATGLSARGHDVTVVTFYPGGELEEKIADTNVQLISANKRNRWDILAFTCRLAAILRRQEADVIHSFLGPPNLLAAGLSPIMGRTKSVWGIRASDMDLRQYDWTWKLVAGAEKMLSGVPELIIANAEAGRHFAIENGFPKASLKVVPNGIDVETYRPNRSAGSQLRRSWQREPEEIIIGLAARLDPMKDHPNFLTAAANLKSKGWKARYVCIGDGPDEYRDRLHAFSFELGLSEDVVWAGHQKDMTKVFNALDIATQSSAFGEGFPNAVGEAMSAGVPCVVTDVGDAASIVGDVGFVVAKKEPMALAQAWEAWLGLGAQERSELSKRARIRIVENFSVDHMLDNSERIYRTLIEI